MLSKKSESYYTQRITHVLWTCEENLVFHALVAFDQGELCFYFLDGECVNCGSMVTLPYPKNEDII